MRELEGAGAAEAVARQRSAQQALTDLGEEVARVHAELAMERSKNSSTRGPARVEAAQTTS